MKKILLLLFPVLVTAPLVSAQDSISVLFIGNSYTYVNDLPGMLGSLAASLGKEITIDSKTNGGYTFQMHVNDPLTYTKIHSRPWDVVVIQGQSQEPSFPDTQVDTQTLPYALQLSDSIWANRACSNVMYYMTWGRQNGDPQWTGINTFEKMNTRLYNAYMRIADSSDRSMVSPVGRAWAYVRANHPAINLYNPDESHPSVEGTYLAACTFYAALFRQSPVGSTFSGGLNATTAGILQQAAATVVLDSLDRFHIRPVNAPTQAYFSLVQNGESIQLTNESSRATAYAWTFGDGQGANTEHPQHTYGANGNYAVKLIASSSCNSDTLAVQVLVNSLGLAGWNLDEVRIVTKEAVIEVSSAEAGYLLEVLNLEGKQLMQERSLDPFPIAVLRTNQPVLLKLTNPAGIVKLIRSM